MVRSADSIAKALKERAERELELQKAAQLTEEESSQEEVIPTKFEKKDKKDRFKLNLDAVE